MICTSAIEGIVGVRTIEWTAPSLTGCHNDTAESMDQRTPWVTFSEAEDNTRVHVLVIMSVFICTAFYQASGNLLRKISPSIYDHLPSSTQTAWCARFSSTLPCMVVTTMASMSLLIGQEDEQDPISGHSALSSGTIAILMGFMIQETFIHLYHYETKEFRWPSIIAHHVLITFATEYVLQTHIFHYPIMWRMLAEFSTPWVNLRVCLLEAGQRNNTLYSFAGAMIVVLFFVFRIATIPYFYYMAYCVTQDSGYSEIQYPFWSLISVAFFLDYLNIKWFSLISRAAVDRFVTGPPQGEVKEE